MVNKLIYLLRQVPRKIIISVMVGLIFKVFSVLIVLDWVGGSQSVFRLFITAGDTQSYIEPVYNFLKKGEYYSFSCTEKVLAGRMPFYGLIWAAFNLAFPNELANNLLIVAQIAVSFIALSTAYVIGLEICERKVYRISVTAFYFICCIMPALSYIDLLLLPDSFSMSSLYLLIFYFYKYFKISASTHLKHVLSLGILGAVSIIMRPHLLPIVAVIWIAAYFVQLHRRNFTGQKPFNIVSLVALPTLLLLAPWIIRNAIIMDRFIPFQQDTEAGYASLKQAEYVALRGYVSAWGGRIAWFERGAESCYFFTDGVNRNKLHCDTILPEAAYTKKFSKDFVKHVRYKFEASFSDCISDNKIATIFIDMKEEIRTSDPLLYYVLAPLKLVYNYILFDTAYFYQTRNLPLLLVLFFTFGAYAILLSGIIGMIVFFRSFYLEFFAFIYLVGLFCIILKRPEAKLASHLFIFALVPASYLVDVAHRSVQGILYK
jgi:hypothetical protein